MATDGGGVFLDVVEPNRDAVVLARAFGLGPIFALVVQPRIVPRAARPRIKRSVMATNVALYKSLPYEPLTDFIPLALLGQTPFVLIVNASLPVKSVADLVAYAKAHTGQMSFASVGPGVPGV